MSSAEAAPHPDGRPSVFLSYASEDRAAVRKLRDALNAAGVDAWYDENELTGGDAWDTKIRRQIRECTYFMPVISTRASARLEGYFRREWRFALERMLDMADDVVFLLPVVIDESQENTARVPEKFLTVQWLRVPAGDATKAFHDLARRLAAGGPHRLHHAPVTRVAEKNSGPRAPQYLPPPEPEAPAEWWRKPKFFWKQLPRWVRFFGWCALIIFLLNSCSRCSDKNEIPGETGKTRRTPTKTGKKAEPTDPSDAVAKAAAVGAQVESALRRSGIVDQKGAARRQIDVIFISGVSKGAAGRVWSDLYGKFVTASGVSLQLSATPLKEGETALDRAAAAGARTALTCTVIENSDGRSIVRVQLDRVADQSVLWSADYPADESAALISAQAYAQILPLVMKKD
ncbi:MAG: hypothetical protein C0518_04640 [Opitutus sp.]|nr:hypothetical protein [Opitutus sp.]